MEVNMEEQNNKVLMLAVAFDESKNTYSVDIPQGSSLNEVAFNMAVVIRCLLKDGIIKDSKEVTDLIIKYCTDGQYEEVKEVTEVN